MDAERFRQIQDIFDAALDRTAGERAYFLDAACAGDPDLRSAVERYLRADADADAMLDVPIARVKALGAPADPSTIVRGHTIGGYRVERLLGEGGMGVVYLARDHRLDRLVAVKLLSPHLGEDQAAKARLLLEARAAAALDHPNVATIYEVGETGAGRLFIAMAYYPGETLEHRITRGPIPVAEAVRIAAQVACGLEAAHRRGVVHRDIKPANLILTPEDQVKIVDFGIARVVGRDSSERRIVGTVAYMSPEQAQGEGVDHRTDLWSLGVVLYEMLAGRRPFFGTGRQDVLDAILHTLPEPPARPHEAVPPTLQRIVDRLLAKSPGDRYAQARDVHTDLERFAGRYAEVLGESHRSDASERLPDNLPVPPTSFVGRSRALRHATALFARTRLLTITGTGGTGKTRFALRLAAGMPESFPDGVCFVSLEPLNDPHLVASTIAVALGLRETERAPASERLVEFLRDKQALLVLDNFEHVVEAGPLVAELLVACPGLKVLVTSRVPLHLQGEQEFPLPPLTLPAAGHGGAFEQLLRCEAVALFEQRAQSVKPSFSLSPNNAATVAEICAHLDGLPLAIELAAARIKVLPLGDILTRLQHRLDLLTGGARDMPARHRTLREAIGWSYDLLTNEEKKLFRRLAVFVGGHTVDAAGQVAAAPGDLSVDVLDGLTSLVDKSLVRQEEQPDGTARFLMLETIREFGMECLVASGEEAIVRRAHGDVFLALAERTAPLLRGPQQAQWLVLLEREQDNLRAALDRTLGDDDVETAARLGAALWRFWLMRGYLNEGSERLARVLTRARASLPHGVRAQLLTGAGTLAHNQGYYRKARMLYAESLAMYRAGGDRTGTAVALIDLGWIGWRLGDYEAAQSLSEEGLALHRTQEDRRGMAMALNNLGWVAHYRGDYARAQEYFEEVLSLQQTTEDRRGVAFASNCLGWTLASRGDYTRAQVLLEEALRLLREVGDRQLTAFTLARLGAIHDDIGNPERAATLLEQESLPLFRAIGDSWGVAFACNSMGGVAAGRGHFERAEALYEESMALRIEAEDAFGVAETLSGLATLHRLQRDYPGAARHFGESLRMCWRIGARGSLITCLEGLAFLAADMHRARRAACLFGAAIALRTASGGTLPPREQAAYAAATAALRTVLGDSAWTAARDAGRAMDLSQAVAYAIEEKTKGMI